MSRWLASPERWHTRWAFLGTVIAVPFAGFLVSNHYPTWRVESLAALAALLGVAAALAAVARGGLFPALILLCAIAVAVVPARQVISRIIVLPPAVVALALLALFAVMLLALRREFYTVMVAFAVAAFTAHVVVSWDHAGGGQAQARSETPAPAPGHFLYLVLDEHMAPGGMPADIEACRRAAAAVEHTFQRHGFRLYVNAWSNYPVTLDSLPSMMNRRLTGTHHMLVREGSPDAYGIQHVDARRFFAHFRRLGYAVHVVQYRAIDYVSGEDAATLEYAMRLGMVAGVEGPWTEKFRLLVATYQHSDQAMLRVKGFFPFRFGERPTCTAATARCEISSTGSRTPDTREWPPPGMSRVTPDTRSRSSTYSSSYTPCWQRSRTAACSTP